jgi:hypothetical protein
MINTSLYCDTKYLCKNHITLHFTCPIILRKILYLSSTRKKRYLLQSIYKGRVDIGGVYLPSQLERTPQLCT